MWLRMIVVAWRIAGPQLLCPWRSPLVRWRLETFGVTDGQGRLLTAGELDARRCLAFFGRHRRELARFLRWAALLSSSS